LIIVESKNRCKIRIAGRPSERLDTLPVPGRVAATPARIPGIRPRLLKGKGDNVRIGTPLFCDKSRPEIRFVSPGCGEITDIVYGPRRIIEQIVIGIKSPETHERFKVVDDKTLGAISRKDLVASLLDSGLWPFLHDVTTRAIASPADKPSSVWVSLDPDDPFQPLSRVVVSGKEDVFAFGVKVLKLLAPKVNVCERDDMQVSDPILSSLVTHRVSGPYPAGDPSVLHYRTKKGADENRAWYISAQDLVCLAESLMSGQYCIDRVAAVSGPGDENQRHVLTRAGTPLASLVTGIDAVDDFYWICGGLFTGTPLGPDDFLGRFDASLTIIPKTDPPRLFGFLRPGADRPGCSRAYLSAFLPGFFPPDAGMHGEERACINCGTCASICPVDILPQFLYKSILTEEFEDALAHGLLDCAQCGFCSYSCPSKIELAETFGKARQDYFSGKI